MRREPFRFELAQAEAAAFLSASGWTVDEVLSARELSARFLGGSPLAGSELETRGFAVSAHRTATVT